MITLNLQYENKDTLHRYLIANLSSNYNHLIFDDQTVTVFFKDGNPSQEDSIILNNLQQSDIQEPTPSSPSQEQIVINIIQNAINFGQQLIIEYAAGNVMQGITQAGKTKEVADYLTNVVRYLQSGSLYEVINEVDRLILEEIPINLSPYVTVERLTTFKTRIQNYLT